MIVGIYYDAGIMFKVKCTFDVDHAPMLHKNRSLFASSCSSRIDLRCKMYFTHRKSLVYISHVHLIPMILVL